MCVGHIFISYKYNKSKYKYMFEQPQSRINYYIANRLKTETIETRADYREQNSLMETAHGCLENHPYNYASWVSNLVLRT